MPLSRVPPRVLACLLALLAAFAWPAAAATYIEAGRTFQLGGEQSAPILVEGRNRGTVEVDVLLETAGRETRIARVAPGKAFSLELPPRTIALFRNGGSRRAVLAFSLTDDVGRLSMRYDAP